MVGPSHLKTFHSLHVSSMKPLPPSSSSSTSTLSSMKLKTPVHTFIFTHLCRAARALSKAKSILIQILKEIQVIQLTIQPLKRNKKCYKNKLFLGSFRLHYNWCSSSHVLPVSSPVLDGFPGSHAYYDSTWNSIINPAEHDDVAPELRLSGYLHWLEEKKAHENCSAAHEHDNDIDRLADMFIASCHEKFRLEKQESYRRFQEMMSRSV